MKHLWISIGILSVLLCALLANNMHLKSIIAPMTEQLSQATELAKDEQWNKAQDLLKQTQAKWDEKGSYLHILLQHKEIDEVALLFHEADEYLQCQKIGEFSAVNARLMEQLNLICEMEQLTLHNIL